MDFDLTAMPPQVKAIYENMVKPKLAEMHDDQLVALKDFICSEIDDILYERLNP